MQVAEIQQSVSAKRTSGRTVIVTVLGLLASGGAISLGWNAATTPAETPHVSTVSPPSPSLSPSEPVAPVAAAPATSVTSANRDEDYRKLAVGTWETNRSGRRLLVVNPDGTATMDVTVEGAWSYAVGKQIKLDFNWTIENDKVTFETTGGEPAASVDIITKLYGKCREQPIVELSAKTFRLHDDEPSEPDHVYTRVDKVP